MKPKQLFFCLLVILITSKIIIACVTYDDIQKQNRYDFKNYQKLSQSLIGQETDITKRDWQYPPLYSIIIIPTLFYDAINYLIIFNIILIGIAYFYLSKFCKLFVDDTKAYLIAFGSLFFNFAFLFNHMGMPISLSALLFIIFSYNLYKIKTNFIYCSISFMLLILTKYLFIALVPFIIYWIMVNYKEQLIRLRIIIFSLLPLTIISLWFIRNAFNYELSVIGIIGGYGEIELNIYLIPDKILFLFTDAYSRTLIIVYIVFIVSYLILKHLQKEFKSRYLDSKAILFNRMIIIYFITTFFLFGFLYNIDGFRVRYFIYYTPIIVSMAIINTYIIDRMIKYHETFI